MHGWRTGHSDRSDLTGFDNAALMAWKLTIINVSTTAPAIVAAKSHHEIVV